MIPFNLKDCDVTAHAHCIGGTNQNRSLDFNYQLYTCIHHDINHTSWYQSSWYQSSWYQSQAGSRSKNPLERKESFKSIYEMVPKHRIPYYHWYFSTDITKLVISINQYMTNNRVKSEYITTCINCIERYIDYFTKQWLTDHGLERLTRGYSL